MQQTDVSNRLLTIMSAEDFTRLAEHLAPVDLPRHMCLAEPNQRISHVYFLEEGIASIIVQSPAGKCTEAGLIGREGFTPPAVALGSDRIPHESTIQIAGRGYRMDRETFEATIDCNAHLKALLLRFAHVMDVQIAHTALSNAVHSVEQRLARWLLLIHDRADSDDLNLTHEFMSVMLSVRRPTVTLTLHELEGRRLIRLDRSYITVRNRAALEEFARDAYGTSRAEYERLIGPFTPAMSCGAVGA